MSFWAPLWIVYLLKNTFYFTKIHKLAPKYEKNKIYKNIRNTLEIFSLSFRESKRFLKYAHILKFCQVTVQLLYHLPVSCLLINTNQRINAPSTFDTSTTSLLYLVVNFYKEIKKEYTTISDNIIYKKYKSIIRVYGYIFLIPRPCYYILACN